MLCLMPKLWVLQHFTWPIVWLALGFIFILFTAAASWPGYKGYHLLHFFLYPFSSWTLPVNQATKGIAWCFFLFPFSSQMLQATRPQKCKTTAMCISLQSFPELMCQCIQLATGIKRYCLAVLSTSTTELPPFHFASSQSFTPNPIDPYLQFSFHVPTMKTALDSNPARSQTTASVPWPASHASL